MATCVECGAELPPGARYCPGCAAPVADEPAPASEERKLATVLFADLVGSTELGGAQDPERTRAMLDRFYDAMAAEVDGSGGTVEKFAGDAVMAAFGVPVAQEDHAERALHAALAMQRRLAELFGDSLALRIGVNTGEVVVGRPREGSSFVTGDAVNVGARLEQAAAAGEILVGERTVAAARGAFEFDDCQTVEAKGKIEGVECRRLIRALSLARPRGVGGLRRAFVGRESELELLLATYHRVASEGGPHLVTIMGDAGVGKTTLVRELWQRLSTESPEPLRRTGRCLAYGQGITYWPLGEVLKEHFGVLESDSPEVVRRRLGGRQILGLTLGLDPHEELHPLSAHEKLQDAWVAFLEELTAGQPVVMLIEDLYWAEDPLLDLVERLLRDIRAPVLLLATARPELLDRRPAWGGGRRNASLLWLEPLSRDHAERMLEELLAAELPDRLREVVVAASEGNPFFVEELIGTLIDQGVLTRENGGWTAAELADTFTVPDSVQAVLAARIDLLQPAEKAALQAASVIGRVFWPGPVCELLDGADPDFDLLEERDFIRRRSGSTMAGEREYAIKHALTREVAYGTLPKARRPRMHGVFAAWLERAGEGREEFAPLLAHHYAQAVRPEDVDLAWAGGEDELAQLRLKAVAWLRRAAELAVSRYAIEEGLALLHQALELEPSQIEQAAIWREIGHASALKFDGEAFWTAMEKSLAVCVDRRTCGETYSELAFQTAARSGMWKRRPDHELVAKWIERALELSEPESPARVRALCARAFWDPLESADAARDASALAERLGDTELRSFAWDARANTAFAAGRYNDAGAWAERGFELVQDLTDPDLVADTYARMIPPTMALGRIREARRIATLNDEATARLTSHHRVHGVSVLLEVEELAGGWDRIRELEPRAEERIAENAMTPCVRNARSLLVCAAARAFAGEETDARRLEEKADRLEMEGYGVVLDGPRVRLALARGDLATVERLVAKPVEQNRRQTWFFLPALAAWLDGLAAVRHRERIEAEVERFLKPRTYLEPFALRALGVVREDEGLIEQAAERFDAMYLRWHADETRKLVTKA